MAKAPFILNTSPLDAETREIAVRELNETPERSAEATEQLRQLLRENTDLYYRDDDQFLISILRSCHFYPESAIKLVSTHVLYTHSARFCQTRHRRRKASVNSVRSQR